MAQGSYLGPLTFVILIDSLKPACLSHKFVDDTTMSEILDRQSTSMIQQFVDELIEWSMQHAMDEYERAQKKEMLIGPIRKEPPPPLSLDGAVID